MIPTTYEADDAVLTERNFLDIKHQEKGSVSNTRNFKPLKEIWFFKQYDNVGGKREAMK